MCCFHIRDRHETPRRQNHKPKGATATLHRTSWREGKRVRHKTVANLALMEPEIVDGFEVLLNGGIAFDPAKGAKGITILRAIRAVLRGQNCNTLLTDRTTAEALLSVA